MKKWENYLEAAVVDITAALHTQVGVREHLMDAVKNMQLALEAYEEEARRDD